MMMRLISLVFCVQVALGLRLAQNTEVPEFASLPGGPLEMDREYPLGSAFQLTKFRGNQEKARVLLLYTTSGADRHIDALCLQSQLNTRPGMPELLRNADIMVYDNGGGKDLEHEGLQLTNSKRPIANATVRKARVHECVGKFANAKELLYMTSSNVGYSMGAVQAMDTMTQAGVFKDYDWVVHFHPDIFLAFPHKLKNALLTTNKTAVAGHMNSKCITFNFFAFKPTSIDSQAFSKYHKYSGSPECYLSDHAFPRDKVEWVPHESYKQKIDYSWTKFGTWHEHEPKYVEKFLKNHPVIHEDGDITKHS